MWIGQSYFSLSVLGIAILSVMKITVFGASGKVGRLIVSRLLAEGHTVTVLIHRHNPFSPNDSLRTVSGSVDNLAAVADAVKGSDAVISTLGSWGTPTKTVVSTGTNSIVQAMQTSGVKRLITLTGASAFYSADQPNWLDRLTHSCLSIVAGRILRDGEAHLKTLEASQLEWTSLRSPVMTSARQSRYRLSPQLPNLLAFVPRQAVAKALVDQLQDQMYFRQAPVIYRA